MATRKAGRLTETALTYQYERYYTEQQMRQGGMYRLPACWRPGGAGEGVWRRLEGFCRSLGEPPRRYIRWALRIDKVFGGPMPEPNELPNRGWAREFRADMARGSGELKVRMRFELGRLEDVIASGCMLFGSRRKGLLYALGNETDDLSPLLRYILARTNITENFRSLAERLRPDALMQFSRDPRFYSLVVRSLPEGFAADAEEHYLLTLAGYDRHVTEAANA